MLSALMVTAVLSCKPYSPPVPPPQSQVACEGADRVRRRTADGAELGRWRNACAPPRPVRLTTDPEPVRFGLSSRG